MKLKTLKTSLRGRIGLALFAGFLAFSSSPQAESRHRFSDKDFEILQQHIRLDTEKYSANLSDWLTSLSNSLIQQSGWCSTPRCFERGLKALLIEAEERGISDPIIRTGILRQKKSFRFENGQFSVAVPKKKEFSSKQKERRRNREYRRMVRYARKGKAPMPGMMAYLSAKEEMRQVRLKKGVEGEISQELSQTLMKRYPRKVVATGQVPLEASMLARYTRGQIEQLANLTTQAHQQMTSLSAEVVFLRDDYRQLLQDVEYLEMEVSDQTRYLLDQVSLDLEDTQESDEEEEETGEEPSEEKELPEAVQYEQLLLSKKIHELELKRAELAASSSEAALLESKKSRDSLRASLAVEKDPTKLLDLRDQLDDLDEVIAVQEDAVRKNKVVVKLSPDDADSLTMNFVEATLASMSSSSAFSGSGLQVGDILGAVALNGDLSSATLLKITKFTGFQEKHNTKLEKAGLMALNLGKMVLMTNPVTAPYITIGTLVWQSHQSMKKNRKAEADRIRYVR